MKVLFLDIDGVLNSVYRDLSAAGPVLKEGKLRRIRRIVEETGACVVITSSWREHWHKVEKRRDEVGQKIHERFLSHGIEIAGKTPKLPHGREDEIYSFLMLHPDIESFAVLDDAFLSEDFLKDHVVKTSAWRGGLSEADTCRVIEILGKREEV